MKNKVIKTAIVIMLIIALTISDFILLGMNFVTYALENLDDSTSNENVKFIAYFKTEEGEVSKAKYDITSTEMKLYLEVAVKNEGYFEGVITLENANFKLKEKQSDSNINKIDGNTITLNRIRAGNACKLELAIEPIIEQSYGEDMLNKQSTIKLAGNYKDSTEKNISIEAKKKVALILLPPSNIDTSLEAKVITNKIFESEEARLVQIELNSSVVENLYPIKSTTFELALPKGAEVASVISKGTYATNGELDQKLKYDAPQNGLLKVTIENTNKDGKISWKKDAVDSIVVTLKLDKSIEVGQEEYTVKSKVEFYGTETISKQKETKYNLEKQADGIIRATVTNEEKYMYKGKLYSKEQRKYQTTTNIEVNYANILQKAEINQTTLYKSEEAEMAANIEYKETTISKSEFDKILGTEGKLIFKNQNGDEIFKVTFQTQADENGQITLTYPEGTKTLNIEITSPIDTGIIRLAHKKVIKAESYSRAEIQKLNFLVEKAITKYNSSETSSVEYTFERKMSLNETKTAANLTVVPKTLSTATTNEQVKIAITLKTDDEMYDLYKNPSITIKLPDGVKSINAETLKTNKLYLDDFKITNATYNKSTHEIQIKLSGEQTAYTISNTNAYIEIMADIDLEELTPNMNDKIVLTYTNENAINYENSGETEVAVKLAGHSGLVAYNNITNYNVKSNSVQNKEAQVANLKMNAEETEANFQIALLNNTGYSLQDVTVLGSLPVQGNIKIGENTFENTIQATLKSGINLPSEIGTVYYTENANANTNLSDVKNGWTTDLSQLQTPVLYLIKIVKMEKATNIVTSYTMQIPANLEYDKEMKTAYVAQYMSNSSTMTIKSAPVGLETGKVLVTLDATVGGEKLENGASVKAGEVIKYKINVTNNGGSDATNVKVSSLVPEGTVYVEPNNHAYIAPIVYFEEDEKKTTFETIIETLKSGETRVIEYNVRVKALGQAINKAKVIYNEDIEVPSNETNYNLEEGSIRVTVKRATEVNTRLIPNQQVQYYATIENITNSDQKDVNVQFKLPEGIQLLNVEEITNEDTIMMEAVNNVDIKNLEAGKLKLYELHCLVNKIEKTTRDVQVTVLASYNGNSYRSNAYKETIYGQDVAIQMTATHEGEYLKAGDTIEYEITLKNNSVIPATAFTLEDEIPQELTITKVEVDGKEQATPEGNLIYKSINLKADSETKIKIYTIVNYDTTRLEQIKISNTAQLKYLGKEVQVAGPIVHYLESIVVKPPVDPDIPDIPDNPDNPENPDIPENPDKPEVKKYSISGKAWVDQDKDGEFNNKDTILSEITIKLLNVKTNEFVRNEEGNKDLEAKPDKDGYYTFENIPEGKYIVVFEYDNTLYKPTTYKKNNISASKNSDVVSKILTINGEQNEYATTDEITLDANISNINIGVVFTKQFDIKVDKYVSKVIVQTSKGTTTYDYDNKTFAKVEINAKRMAGSTVIVQYTIKLTNIGDVDAYVNSVVDYAPAGLKFSSELNKDWYESAANLHTNILASTSIAPGESKAIDLVLTKNVGEKAELINNIAEIEDAYNIYGIEDTNSVQANKNKDENDLGSADLIIGVQTGTVFNYIAVVISMMGIIGVAAYLINKKVLHMKF